MEGWEPPSHPTGVAMSVYQVVLGSAWIVLGTSTGAQCVIALTLGRTRLQMSVPGARGSKWRLLGGSVMNCFLGIVLVTDSLHGNTARWLLGTSATALLIWYVSSDLGPASYLAGDRRG
jgi:hypothetical protein